MRLVSAFLIGSCFACTACDRSTPAPDGEAVIVVDTNLPVPGVASRLRIDVYTSEGTWIATRDDVRPDARDWPASFSIFNDDPSREPIALVRLRAYPEGRLARYSGIFFAPLAELLRSAPKGDGQPRLMIDGVDQTPEFEPDPTVTVDRVVRIRLAYGRRGRVQVLLDGACTGQMARLQPWNDVRSCTDGSEPLAVVHDAALDPTLDYDLPTQAGTWGRQPCVQAGPDSGASGDRVCVPGGGFLFGDAFLRTSGTFSNGMPANPQPERVLRISRFLIDRDEVSVARYRAATVRGFAPVTPVGVLEKDGPPGADPEYSCTYSASPRGREDYPLSCVSWDTARALCRFEGGDLPTEAQWEYLAVAAGRSAKATWPWGDDSPDCGRAVYGRSFLYPECVELGTGVQPLTAPGAEATTNFHPLGVMNLAGSLMEYMRDTLLPYNDPCWTNAPAVDPTCWVDPLAGCPDDNNPSCLTDPGRSHGTRGGSWLSASDQLLPVSRVEWTTASWQDVRTGFRCAYQGP